MAHKPMVGGTVYEIAKGKDLAGGTVYEKDHGKTIAGGTVYEVAFATVISFTVRGDTYYAEEGMTWAELVESDYNPDYRPEVESYNPTFRISGNYIWMDPVGNVETASRVLVKHSDLIIPGHNYGID